MNTDRELMQQALEMIEDARNGSQRKPSEPVITALRERLAQPEQEPVAHTLNCVCGAVWDVSPDGVEEMVHAPNPPQRKPLTDEEIYECERLAVIRHQRHKHSIRGQQITPADDLQWHFARSIEAAHSIGETE